jgi:hypothetical protein
MPHDETEPKNENIMVYWVVSWVGLFVILCVVLVWFQSVANKQTYIKIENTNSKALADLRGMEQEKLSRYTLDQAAGHVRIPIDQAMKLEARDSWRNYVEIGDISAGEEATSATEHVVTTDGESPAQ